MSNVNCHFEDQDIPGLGCTKSLTETGSDAADEYRAYLINYMLELQRNPELHNREFAEAEQLIDRLQSVFDAD